MHNHWESKSEKRGNFAFMCVGLFSLFLGGIACAGAARIPWMHGGWRDLLAVSVGLTVTVLVCRGVCGFLEDCDEHKRHRAEEKERWARPSQADAKDEGTEE